MSEEGGIGITFKGGPGYEDPWVTVRGKNVEELGSHLEDMEYRNIFPKVKKLAKQFLDTRAAVGAIQDAMPGSQVVQELPEGMQPKCSTCGGPAEAKRGFSAKNDNKPYKGLFCKDGTKGCKPTEFTWL